MKQEKKSIILAERRHFDYKVTRLDFDLDDDLEMYQKAKL